MCQTARCSASIRMINANGPKCDPCGMPADSCNQSDKTSPIFTRCRRSCRKAAIHRTMTSVRARATSLATSKLWSTLSNVLAKSTKTVRTDSPLSTATCQWCSMSTNACVVDRCLRALHCQSFKRLPTCSRIYHSCTLASVALRRYRPHVGFNGSGWLYFWH